MIPVNGFTLHGFVRDRDECRNGYNSRKSVAWPQPLIDTARSESACAGRAMDNQETGYDYIRYKQLLAEAETRRLELIETMIRENARDRLEAQRTADRVAMTAMTVARVLSPGSRRDNF